MEKKINNIITMIQAGQYDQAAQALSQSSEKEISNVLQEIHTSSNNFTINSISILKRALKPNFSYQDFYDAWLPPLPASATTHTNTGVQAPYFPFPVRVLNAINSQNPNEIISIGLMAATEDDITDLQYNKELLATESIRHNSIKKVSTKKGGTLFFTCKDDNILG